MTYIPVKPQRLHCKHCDEAYSLPQNGSIKLYKVECVVIIRTFEHHFLLPFFIIRRLSAPLMVLRLFYFQDHVERSRELEALLQVIFDYIFFCFSMQAFTVCPYCYSNPPFPDVKKGMTCSTCPHQSCPHAMNQLTIDHCPTCESGTLLLDPASGPKWKLYCNSLTYVYWSNTYYYS